MRTLLALPLLLLLAVSPAHAEGGADGRGGHGMDDREDGARARAALRAGQIRPLAQLMAMVEARYGGRVVATHLEHDHGRWTYELRLLPPSGRLFEVRVDAATGAVIGTRGPAHDRRPEDR